MRHFNCRDTSFRNCDCLFHGWTYFISFLILRIFSQSPCSDGWLYLIPYVMTGTVFLPLKTVWLDTDNYHDRFSCIFLFKLSIINYLFVFWWILCRQFSINHQIVLDPCLILIWSEESSVWVRVRASKTRAIQLCSYLRHALGSERDVVLIDVGKISILVWLWDWFFIISHA